MHIKDKEFFDDKIIEIKEIGYEETLDISVDAKDRLFIANNILTHNSGYDDTDPSMKNTAESMGISHTADFIGSLFQNEGDKESEIIRMKINKNRLGGQIGHITNFHIDYSGSSLKITNIDVSDQDCDSVTQGIMDEIIDLEDI